MILGDWPFWFIWGALFVIGTCIGSFLNVCIYRLPRHEAIGRAWRGIVSPPSACPFCQHRILSLDNLPLIGWLQLGGRCRNCRHTIPIRYPLVELLNGILWVVLYAALVPVDWGATLADSAISSQWLPRLPGLSFGQQELWLHVRYVYYLILVEALLVASFIDWDLQIIPDSVTAPAAVVGLIGSLTGSMALLPVWFQDRGMMVHVWDLWQPDAQPPLWWVTEVPAWCSAWPIAHGLAVSLAGAVVGGGTIWFVRLAGAWVFRRETMGFGDVTLMAMIGTFLGWQPMLIIFFLAPLFVLATMCITTPFRLLGGDRAHPPREIPYGPYLSMAALAVVLGWKWVFPAFERYFLFGPAVPVAAVVMGVLLVGLLWMMQGIKWLLGWPLYEPDWIEEWTSADQLTFYANKPDPRGVRPVQNDWPGTAAGRGRLQEQRWRGPHS